MVLYIAYRVFVLDRTKDLRGTIREIFLRVLLEKWFASKENLLQPEGKVSRLANYPSSLPPILLLPSRFLLELYS